MDTQKILGLIIMLMAAPIMLGIGAIVVFETTGSIDVDDARVDYENVLSNTTFSTVRGSWENTSGGDNVTLAWSTFLNATDNSVWDNVGADTFTAPGVRTNNFTRWSQDLVIPTAINGITSATVTGIFLVSDNTELENISVEVILGRPSGENFTVLFLDNTTALIEADNATWFEVDNNVLSAIESGGTYTLYLQDNIDRMAINNDARENLRGVVWDNFSLSITTYTTGYLENTMADVEQQTGTGFSLGSLVPLIIAAIALISIIVAGFVGMSYRGRQ